VAFGGAVNLFHSFVQVVADADLYTGWAGAGEKVEVSHN